jgi:high affinity sulfate transporter 1
MPSAPLSPAEPRAPAFFRGLLPLGRSQLRTDLLAGLTLAAMNIPQAMGYTKIAGLPPITGLYTLLLPVIAFALLGASRYLVVAADSATAAILAVGVAPLAAEGSPKYLALASMVALLAAGCLLMARLFRLGFLADFLSRTVLIGFLTGIGFQVGIAVLGQMLGIAVESHHTVAQFWAVVRHLPHFHGPTLAVSAGVVAIILGTRALAPRLPAPLVAVLGALILSAVFDFAGHGIAVLGPIEGGLPHLGFPAVTWNETLALLPTAGACFVMIVAQSAVTARAYAARHHQPLDENRDLIGLAAADAAAGLSGTFVVNGSPTQTAMVDASGGRSQFAHLTTAAVVAVVLLFFTGPLRYLPVCVLGALVFTVAVGLIDFKALRKLQQKSPQEFYVAVFTAAAVILFGVKNGILLALTLSLLDHVRHGYHPHTALIMRDPDDHWRMEPVVPGRMIEPGLVLYWFGADLYYANAYHFTAQAHLLAKGTTPDGAPVRCVAVDSGAITGLDYTAASELKQLCRDLEKAGVTLAFTRVNEEFHADLRRFGLVELIGEKRVFHSRHACIAAFNTGS